MPRRKIRKRPQTDRRWLIYASGALLCCGIIALIVSHWPIRVSESEQLLHSASGGGPATKTAVGESAATGRATPPPVAAATTTWIDPTRLPADWPKRLEEQHGFATSAACLQCHPDEHQSWYGSFHRQMTQLPSDQTIRAPFENVSLTDPRGWRYDFQKVNQEYWVDMVDLDWYRAKGDDARKVMDPPRKRQQIALVTGSHHKQAFWVRSSVGQYLLRLPWSYRIDDGRWIPLEFDFLAPPGTKGGGDVWDVVCIKCHSVGGQPRANEQTTFDSHVAELGISCEACHGPGAKHIAYRQERAKQLGVTVATPEADPGRDVNDPIFNPGKCDSKVGTQVCGSCHSYSLPKDPAAFERQGFEYRPGDDLHETRHVVLPSQASEPWVAQLVQHDSYALEGSFWGDGAIRVAGREYNGLLESACYQKGELSCMSCHSQHAYQQPDDLLGAGMEGNHACVKCHSKIAGELESHTHHRADSSGSQCQNCHMPHTTYGLFKGVRAHRIDSPSVEKSVSVGRPNACNLCHLDRTLEWTAEAMTKWYGTSAVPLEGEQRTVAASLLWLLRGDAAQRAISAWHMGWKPAQEASGTHWMAPHLSMAFLDPYPAVRNVAGRSLRKLPGYTEFPYDFLAPVEQQRIFLKQVAQSWMLRRNPTQRLPSPLLFTPAGLPDASRVSGLLRARSSRFVFIDE